MINSFNPALLRAGFAALARVMSASREFDSVNAPKIFDLIQERGPVDPDEMYRVFNMGIGMALFCPPDSTDKLLATLPGAIKIGEVVEGDRKVIIA